MPPGSPLTTHQLTHQPPLTAQREAEVERVTAELRRVSIAWEEAAERAAAFEGQAREAAQEALEAKNALAHGEVEARRAAAAEHESAVTAAKANADVERQAHAVALAAAEEAAAVARAELERRQVELEETQARAARLALSEAEAQRAAEEARAVAEAAAEQAAINAANSEVAVAAGSGVSIGVAALVGATKRGAAGPAAGADATAPAAAPDEAHREELKALRAQVAALETELQHARHAAVANDRLATPPTGAKRSRVSTGGPHEEPSWLQRSLSGLGLSRQEGLPLIDTKAQAPSRKVSSPPQGALPRPTEPRRTLVAPLNCTEGAHWQSNSIAAAHRVAVSTHPRCQSPAHLRKRSPPAFLAPDPAPSRPVSQVSSRQLLMLLYVVIVHGLLLFNVASHLHHHGA